MPEHPQTQPARAMRRSRAKFTPKSRETILIEELQALRRDYLNWLCTRYEVGWPSRAADKAGYSAVENPNQSRLAFTCLHNYVSAIESMDQLNFTPTKENSLTTAKIVLVLVTTITKMTTKAGCNHYTVPAAEETGVLYKD
ncbi:unnamed protein product [Echinostoma caproni]|uniref:HTH_OrfB_IS605 domain-containing protein n=1 Tax=Echinostoma caproni TaxID=27848 RepID=A0A183AW69_9TREM|nr:unnamed protein product [Echinostoma caproni]